MITLGVSDPMAGAPAAGIFVESVSASGASPAGLPAWQPLSGPVSRPMKKPITAAAMTAMMSCSLLTMGSLPPCAGLHPGLSENRMKWQFLPQIGGRRKASARP